MGIGSLFGLNLSLLAEVVRMLFDGLGKKGKPARRSPDQASLAGSPFGALAAPCRLAPAAVLGSWVSTALHGSISVTSRSVLGHLLSGAPKVDLSLAPLKLTERILPLPLNHQNLSRCQCALGLSKVHENVCGSLALTSHSAICSSPQRTCNLPLP